MEEFIMEENWLVYGGKMGAMTRKLSDLYYEEAKKGVAVFDE